MTGLGPQTEAAHYSSWDYNSKGRLCSMWHQTDELRRLGARTVLEVGPGNGTVTGWLRGRGIEVTTVDIDPAVGPDRVGPVTELPFPDGAFDAVLCCEVLEHIPFDMVTDALSELRRVARDGVVVSVPDDTPWLGVGYPLYFGMHVDRLRPAHPTRRSALAGLALGRLRWREALFLALVPSRWAHGDGVAAAAHPPIPHTPWRHEFDGEHHWELGTEGYPASRLTDLFTSVGLAVVRDFRVPENPWHHFWTLARA